MNNVFGTNNMKRVLKPNRISTYKMKMLFARKYFKYYF